MKRVAFFRDLFAIPRRRLLARQQVRNSGRAAGLEKLERRQVLTGNVTATVSAGSLIVVGDEAGNAVELSQSGANLVLRGLSGTTVNGASEFVVRTGSTRVEQSLFAYLNGGNDTFSLGDGVSVRRDAFLFLGEGDDTFAMQGATAHRRLHVDLGNGDDNISLLHATVSRDVTLVGGLGDKTVSVSDSFLGRSFTLVTTSGNDAVLLDNVDIHGVASVLNGLGNDDVLIGDAVFHKTAVIDTSLGDDVVRLDPGSTFSDPVVVALGDGNDALLADGGNTFNDTTYFFGQTGTDAIDTSGDNDFNGGVQTFDADQSTVDETALNTRLNASTGALARATALQAALESLITLPILTVTNSGTTIAENATTTLTGTATRPTATFGDVDVTLTSSDTTELTVPATVTIPAGKTSVTFAITPVNDTNVDGAQSVTISAKAVGYALGKSPVISVTDEETPALTLSFPASTINEAAPGNVTTGTVTRPSGSTSDALTVTITNSSSAQATAPATVTIAAGQTSATFDLTAVDDTTVDGSQTVSITVSATGFNADTETVSVTDNDASEALTLSFNPTSFTEAAGSKAATGTVSRTGATTNALVVTLVSNDTSEATVPASVTIPAGQTSITFDVAAVEDAIVDGSQTVSVIASATGFSSDSENITVTDNDVSSVLSLSFDPETFSEGAGSSAATGTLTRTGNTTNALTVTLTSDDTSEATVPASVTIPAGQTSVTFTVSAVEDAIIDGPQETKITASATGHTSGSETLLVTDNDGELLSLTLNPTSVSESAGATASTATISRNTDTTNALIVTLSSSVTTAATVPATVTIPAGETAATFAITAINDALADGTQTTTISATAAGFLLPATADLNVTDDEGAAALTVTLNPSTISESAGNSATTGTVARNSPTTDALEVTLSSSLISAATVVTTVTIPAGQSTATFAINAVDNDIENATQTVTITASATSHESDSATLSVTDNEVTPTLELTLAANAISEASGANVTSATVTRTETSTTEALIVTLSSSDISEVTVPATVTIPAGQSSFTFDVTAIDDAFADGTQSVTLTATANGFTSDSSSISVSDDDGPAALSVSLNPAIFSESASAPASVGTVRRNTETTSALEVSLSSSLTANVTVPATVTIPAGQESVTFNVTAINDIALTGQQSVLITATAAAHANGNTLLELTDDEAPTLDLTVNLSEISEDDGSGAATGTVTRPSDAITAALTVTLTSSNSNKVVVPSSVTIPAGQTSVTFDVDAVDNGIADGAVTVTVTASATNFNDDSTTVEVTDDDGPATLTVTITETTTGESTLGGLTATVTRNTATTSPQSVSLASSDTTELAVPATVEIPAGQSSVTFSINVLDDEFSDGTQSVTITPAASGFVGQSDSLTVTDNEPAAALTLTLDPTSITESTTETAFLAQVTRNTDPSVPLTVSVSLSPAESLSAPTTITIPINVNTVTFNIGLTGDDIFTGTRTADVTVTAGELSDSATLSIFDDDSPTLSVALDPSTISETAGANAVTGTVSRPAGSTANDAIVTLAVSDLSEATVAATVTIPAGKTSVTFSINAVDDSLADGSQSVTVTASAELFLNGTASLVVTDNELELELDTPTTGVANVNGDLITKTESFTLTGNTSPQAAVELDVDGDGFDDGTATANQDGDFSFATTLSEGANTLRVRSTAQGESVVATRELSIHYAVGSVIQFQSSQGTFAVELLDAAAPITVANFKSYLTSYTNSVVHASVNDFIVQGGGYTVDNAGAITAIPENAPITNEFNAGNSNVRGTLSMALVEGDDNSGTNQWFINVNSSNSGLDVDLHTVFGRVIGNGMDVVDTINSLPRVNLEVQTDEVEFGSVPVIGNLSFEPLSGTVAVTSGSALVNGTGTAFETELVDALGDSPGSTIRIGAEVFEVAEVISDTLLRLNDTVSTTQSAVVAERHAAPNKAAYVVFSNIGEILNGGT